MKCSENHEKRFGNRSERSENELERRRKTLGKASENGTKGNEIRWNRVATRSGVAIAYNLQSSINNQQSSKRDARESRLAVEKAFEEFWKIWPNKVEKKTALKAFEKALKAASLETILAGVKAYIAHKPPDRAWLNPTTWLNRERWNDVYENGLDAGVPQRHPPSEAERQSALAEILAISDSEASRNEIPESLKGYSTLTTKEQFQWHAYNYGIRERFLGEAGPGYGPDPNGQFYNRTMVQQVLATLYPPPKLKEYTTIPADEYEAKGNHEMAEHCRRQDREREAAKARIKGDGRNPDGTPTPEAIAYVELCSRQVRANMTQFYTRNTQAFAEPRANPVMTPPTAPKREPNYPDKRSVDELLASPGVRATEQEPP